MLVLHVLVVVLVVRCCSGTYDSWMGGGNGIELDELSEGSRSAVCMS